MSFALGAVAQDGLVDAGLQRVAPYLGNVTVSGVLNGIFVFDFVADLATYYAPQVPRGVQKGRCL
jgi:hypothetical protein